MKTVAILAALAVATEARFEDVKAYETFDANTCITSATTKVGGVYADAMTLTVPFRGEDLTLDLTADRGLFADDWKLVDNEGNVLSTDKEAFMCHYTGTVQGKKDSRVTISVCDEAGINGLIETGDFAAEIQPVDPSVSLNNLGSHIIYDMEDLVLRDDISFGEALDEFGNEGIRLLTVPANAANAHHEHFFLPFVREQTCYVLEFVAGRNTGINIVVAAITWHSHPYVPDA